MGGGAFFCLYHFSLLFPCVWETARYRQGSAVVDWLERLGYGAESRRKVVRSPPGFAMSFDDWKTLSVSERRGMGSAFYQLCPGYCAPLASTAPAAIRQWETFYLILCQKVVKPKPFKSPFPLCMKN